MRRPLPLLLFGLMAGIFTGSFYPLPFSWPMAGILGGCLFLFLLFISGRGKGAAVAAPLIFTLFGLLFIGRVLYPEIPSHDLIHFADDQRHTIEGVLYRPPEPLPEKTRLYVRGERIYFGEGYTAVSGNLLLTVRERTRDLRYGDRVRFISKIYRPRPATNPGGFDYQRFLALQEIRFTGYVNSAAEVVRMAGGKGSAFYRFVDEGRERIRAFLDQNAPAEYGGIMKALILGERGDIGKELNEKFIVSGVNHILSISGLHVALVAAFFFGITRFLIRLSPYLLLRFDLNKISALVAIVPVIFYVFIAGLGVAAVRSTIMALSFLLALLLDREKDLYDALFLAAFFILIVLPAALFDISFQLSFLSVLAMLYLVPRFAEFCAPLKKWAEERTWWKRKILIYVGASLLTSAAAVLGTGPLVGFYFNRISLVGFLANLVLVPLMGFGSTLLTLLTGLFVFVSSSMAQLLTDVNILLLKTSVFFIDFFSRWPMASRRVATPSWIEILLFYGMVLFAANLKRWKKAVYPLIALIGLFIAIQVYGAFLQGKTDRLQVAFLDVGQGDAAVIHFPNGQVMVIDGGGTPDGSFDPGERVVAPYLWKRKNKQIDFMVNSHPHPDHQQGLFFLLENFAVGKAWVNGERENNALLTERFSQVTGKSANAIRPGEPPVEIGGVRVEFLHRAGAGVEYWGNNASLVLRLTYGEVRFLFCGDVEAAAEEEMIKGNADVTCTVLKVPHHGSKTSSSPPFVEAARPKFVVFTVRSTSGRYRLPHPTVLERYESIGAQALRSDRDGAIFFETNGKDLQVKTYLRSRGSF